jgi:Polyketide cyclase / dehydrase and lipid transport
MAEQSSGGLKGLMDELPVDRLKDELRSGLSTLGGKAVESAGQRLTDLTDRLSDVADGGGVVGKAAKQGAEEVAEGGSPVKGALKGGLSGAKDKVKEKLGGGGGGGGGKGTKATNIIEEIDVGVPVSVAYNAWTEFQEWSGFMKKVDNIDQEDDTKLNFKAQVFWSHRRWEAQILEQVPDEKIVWRSKGEKGHVDGAVTFHEIGPNLTRILVVLEYYPQGLFERTGNLWRAQGRRARLELKHFRRHVMTEVIQNPDDVEGWRGEISDGEVERDHDEVVEEEQQQSEEAEGEEDESGDEEPEDEYAEDDEYSDEEESEEEPEDEYSEDEEPEDEAEEEEAEPEDEDAEEEEPEDEYTEDEEYAEGDEDEEPEETEPEDEYAEDEEYEEEEEPEEEEEEPEEERPRRRRRAS